LLYSMQSLDMGENGDNTTTYLEHYRKWITDERDRTAVLQGNLKAQHDDPWGETTVPAYKSDFVGYA